MTPPEQAMAARLTALRDKLGPDYFLLGLDEHGQLLMSEKVLTDAIEAIERLQQENARLTAECKRLDNAVAEVWDNVHRVVQQAWVKPHDYDDSPLDLIAAVIDERDEAEQARDTAHAALKEIERATERFTLMRVGRAETADELIRRDETQALLAAIARAQRGLDAALKATEDTRGQTETPGTVG